MTAIVLRGDARALPLPDKSVDLIVTSPPFWQLRSYTDGGEHYDGQLGSEPTWQEYIASLLECTREWARVLKPEGSLFVELGDKYSTGGSGENGTGKSSLNGHGGKGTQRDRAGLGRSRRVPGVQPKSLLDLPSRYSIRVVDELGLIKRANIVWHHVNGLPESVTDRVRAAHSLVFHFTRQPRYYAAVDEIREPHTAAHLQQQLSPQREMGRRVLPKQGYHDYVNPLGKLPGSVWSIPSQPLTVPPHLGVDHFAAYPTELPRRIIAGWSPPGVCTACGQGRRPVTMADGESYYHAAGKTGRDPKLRADTSPEGGGNTRTVNGTVPSFPLRTRTITGYACACPDTTAPTRPALVVDPFGGTGTTALVASVLGRTGISFDLSHDYSRLARWRTQDPGERCRVIGAQKPPPVMDGQSSLFDDWEMD